MLASLPMSFAPNTPADLLHGSHTEEDQQANLEMCVMEATALDLFDRMVAVTPDKRVDEIHGDGEST